MVEFTKDELSLISQALTQLNWKVGQSNSVVMAENIIKDCSSEGNQEDITVEKLSFITQVFSQLSFKPGNSHSLVMAEGIIQKCITVSKPELIPEVKLETEKKGD